jgi:hypothetical protein
VTSHVAACHELSLAVWDLPSPIVIGRRARLKVGCTCSSGCCLAAAHINVYDESGTAVGDGRLESSPWPDTAALYWIELDVATPAVEGVHAWTVEAIPPHPSHARASTTLRVVASRLPEHRVTLAVIEKGTGIPVPGVELRLGTFRTATDDTGIAQVALPGDTYEVCAWKIGYELLSTTAAVVSDATIHLEMTPAPQPEQPYWM